MSIKQNTSVPKTLRHTNLPGLLAQTTDALLDLPLTHVSSWPSSKASVGLWKINGYKNQEHSKLFMLRIWQPEGSTYLLICYIFKVRRSFGCVLSHVQFFASPWTVVVHQAPLSMEVSRQEYWSGLPFPNLKSSFNMWNSCGTTHIL